jgi:glycosyltransferase involved in cell wall biosynthesis
MIFSATAKLLTLLNTIMSPRCRENIRIFAAMIIVVNTRLLIPDRLEGIGWFTLETLKRITVQQPEHHFIFLFDRNFDPDMVFSDNVTPLIISPPARHPFLFVWWFELSVASLLRKLKPDLFLSPDGYLSLRSDCRQLAVIHDISFAHYPKDVSFLVRKYYNYFFPRFARKATRIATVSEFSRNDIAKTYNIDPSKIDLVFNGCNTRYKPVTEKQKLQTKELFSAGEDYFLFVGALHPRKNISRLFEAFDKFKESSGSKVKMVIVGKKYYWTRAIKRTYISMKHREDVVFTGRLDNEQLRNVLGSALALTYVPYFEGFGIPILEAFNTDTPVITSNITSMPEVAGDAALLVDPFSVDSIANAMIYLHKDEDIRNSLILKGRKRREAYSWDKTADLLWKSILKTVQTEK